VYTSEERVFQNVSSYLSSVSIYQSFSFAFRVQIIITPLPHWQYNTCGIRCKYSKTRRHVRWHSTTWQNVKTSHAGVIRSNANT